MNTEYKNLYILIIIKKEKSIMKTSSELYFTLIPDDSIEVDSLSGDIHVERLICESKFKNKYDVPIAAEEIGGYVTPGILSNYSWISESSVFGAYYPSSVKVTNDTLLRDSVIMAESDVNIDHCRIDGSIMDLTTAHFEHSIFRDVKTDGVKCESVGIYNSELYHVTLGNKLKIKNSFIANVSRPLTGIIVDGLISSEYDLITGTDINAYLSKVEGSMSVSFNDRPAAVITLTIPSNESLDLIFDDPLSKYYYNSLTTSMKKQVVDAVVSMQRSQKQKAVNEKIVTNE